MPLVQGKRVFLVVDGHIRPGALALRYALNACTRLDADLEVLTNLSEDKIEEAIAREGIVPDFSSWNRTVVWHNQACAMPF